MTAERERDVTLEALAATHDLAAPAVDSLAVLARRLSVDRSAPTTVREPRLVLARHIADSLAGLEISSLARARSIADLGAGAGLPGLALAAALPDARVRAIESQRRKCAFVASLAREAGLENVEVVCRRAEEWQDGIEANQAVVARALAAQPVVLEYAAPLIALGGHLVEWRGRRDPDEERRAALACSELGLELVEIRRVHPFPGAEQRHLHVFAKAHATPPRFPRRPGVAARRPLGRR